MVRLSIVLNNKQLDQQASFHTTTEVMNDNDDDCFDTIPTGRSEDSGNQPYADENLPPTSQGDPQDDLQDVDHGLPMAYGPPIKITRPKLLPEEPRLPAMYEMKELGKREAQPPSSKAKKILAITKPFTDKIKTLNDRLTSANSEVKRANDAGKKIYAAGAKEIKTGWKLLREQRTNIIEWQDKYVVEKRSNNYYQDKVKEDAKTINNLLKTNKDLEDKKTKLEKSIKEMEGRIKIFQDEIEERNKIIQDLQAGTSDSKPAARNIKKVTRKGENGATIAEYREVLTVEDQMKKEAFRNQQRIELAYARADAKEVAKQKMNKDRSRHFRQMGISAGGTHLTGVRVTGDGILRERERSRSPDRRRATEPNVSLIVVLFHFHSVVLIFFPLYRCAEMKMGV